MRPLVFAVASFILSVAFQLTMAKYGADVPDGWLLVLWIVPLVPFVWWLWTHEKVLSRRQQVREYFRKYPWTAVIVTLATLFIVTSCLVGLSYTSWQMLKIQHQANQAKNEPPPPSTGDAKPQKLPPGDGQPTARKHHLPMPPKVTPASGNPPVNQALPPMSQECAPGAKCAQTSGQTGGITAGELNVSTPPTIQSIVMDMQFVCTVRDGFVGPKGSTNASLVVSRAGVSLLYPRGSIKLVFDGLWQVYQPDQDGTIMVAEHYYLAPGSEVSGQPVTILGLVSDIEINAIWFEGDWCSEYKGAVGMKVNGYVVWERRLGIQTLPLEDGKRTYITIPSIPVDIKEKIVSVFKPTD
jgi:hypothetical protein